MGHTRCAKMYTKKLNLSRAHINKQTLVTYVYQIFKIKQNTTNTMLEFYNLMQPKKNVLMQPQSSLIRAPIRGLVGVL